MKQLKYTWIVLAFFTGAGVAQAQVVLDPVVLVQYEEALNDVMELIDGELVKVKLSEVKAAYQEEPTEMNYLRLGLIYHEVALNLTFFDPTEAYAGYAQKSADVLTELSQKDGTSNEARVFIESYRASAWSLIAAETRKLSYLGDAFDLFEKAIVQYGHASPRPEFMRGSVAENLPGIMWRKRKYARIDFTSIIAKEEAQPGYADFRIMSFSYWAWARAHAAKKYRNQALLYLDKAIAIDPHYKAGRQRAEELKASWE